jgi:iron-sulfur cluster assembly protein
MIRVTSNAVNQLQNLLAEKGLDARQHGLRLGVERGGCAGMQYTMQVGQPKPGDEIVEVGGVRIFVEPESRAYLLNSEVDYVDDLSDSGFRIVNPNASRSCGCGTSFEAAGGPGPN